MRFKGKQDAAFYSLTIVEGCCERSNSAKLVLECIRIDFMPRGAPLETTCNSNAALCVMQPLLKDV